ncbi:MAG: hypothetical protein MJE77_27965 [Proteobacteria bacterium]|nr:hypothetical protein [Pseudomonadota bacterium]
MTTNYVSVFRASISQCSRAADRQISTPGPANDVDVRIVIAEFDFVSSPMDSGTAAGCPTAVSPVGLAGHDSGMVREYELA